MIAVPTIRLAALGDALAIAEMSRDQIEAGLAWSWTPERVRHAIRNPATNVAVAQEGGRVVGFGIMGYGEEKAHLSLLAVSPAWRDQGVGAQLLDWLEQCARTAAYGLRGFQRFATVHGYYQGRIDAFRLVKYLAG